jgi:hypothetical protein
VGVGINGHDTPGLDGETQQPFGRIEALRAAIHFDRHSEAFTGGKDDIRVEFRCWATSGSHDHSSRAVTQHVGIRIGDRGHHARRHVRRRHTEAAMHAGDNEVEPA